MDQGSEYKFCWRTEKERIGCTGDETMGDIEFVSLGGRVEAALKDRQR